MTPTILSSRVRADAGVNALEGIGVSEAPRGTLFHHYKVDENGLIEKVNLIIATGHNNLAMNKTITQIAKHYIQGEDIPEGFLNRVEAGIRCYDPCLSCSTHAVGQMPLRMALFQQIVKEGIGHYRELFAGQTGHIPVTLDGEMFDIQNSELARGAFGNDGVDG
jgi:coenzyme F420-reducing hydrogenase alpha subunit